MPRHSGSSATTDNAVRPNQHEDQLDVQAMHRVRERLLEQRTSLVNQLRAFLLERGLVATVAFANKLARIAWTVLSRNEVYKLASAQSTSA